MNERIGVIIPCRNVATTITPLFDSLSPDLLDRIDQILCIDNASSDNTVSLLRDLQTRKDTPYQGKLHILKNSQDYNYGGSIKIGFRYFIEADFDWIIILHSDEQGETRTILSNFFRTQYIAPESDLIIASRFKKDSDTTGYSRSRFVGNLIFNGLTKITTGLDISDSGTAIIMVRTSSLKKLPYFELTNGLHFHPQLNILLYSYPDIRIKEIPLQWQDSDLPSSVRILKYCTQLFRMLIGYRINLRMGKKGAFLFPFHDTGYNPIVQHIQP